jgi:hypothetical protein
MGVIGAFSFCGHTIFLAPISDTATLCDKMTEDAHTHMTQIAQQMAARGYPRNATFLRAATSAELIELGYLEIHAQKNRLTDAGYRWVKQQAVL